MTNLAMEVRSFDIGKTSKLKLIQDTTILVLKRCEMVPARIPYNVPRKSRSPHKKVLQLD